MSEQEAELRGELARVKEELERVLGERRRLTQVLQQQPDLKRWEESQALLNASEIARQASEERNLELVRLLSQASQRQQQLEHELLEQQRQTHEQLADLQATLSRLQQERDQVFDRVQDELEPGSSEVARKLHQQLKLLHQTSKEKLEHLAEELRRRHHLWEEETRHRSELEGSLEAQAKAFAREIRELKRALREAQSDLVDHEFALETNEDQIAWLEGEVEEREEIIDSLRSQAGTYLEKLRQAHTKLGEAGQALQHRNQLLKQFQEQRLTLVSQCRAWEASYEHSESQRKNLGEEIGRLRERIDELEWELDETRVSLEDSQHLVANLQDQVFSQLPRAHQLLREARSREGEATVAEMPAVKENSPADL